MRAFLAAAVISAVSSAGGALAPSGTAFSPAAASADCAYTDVVDFNMYTDARTYPGSPYRVSSLGSGTYPEAGGGNGYYRWSDDPDHTTVIAGSNCYNGSLLGKVDILAR